MADSATVPALASDTSEAAKLAADKLAKARIQMMGTAGCAFITSVCFSIKQVLTRDIPRAATDGRAIYYNPEYVLSIAHDELLGLIVHETWHVALKHCKLQKHSRMGNRDPRLWNIAADVVNNNYIIDSGMKLPSAGGGYVYEPAYADMSTEQIYQILKDQQDRGEPVPLLDIGSQDIIESEQSDDPDNPDDGDPIEQILVRAALTAQQAGEDIGRLPGNVKLIIDAIVRPKLSWDRLVQRFCRARAKTLYNFMRPNRRYMPGFYLPSRSSTTLNNVLIAIDMSGSVSDQETTQFVAEIAQLMRRVKPRQLDLLEFDTRVRAVTRLDNPLQLTRHQFTGRGGTAISPVIHYANDNPSDLVIIFTDGIFPQPSLQISAPVLWVIYNNRRFTSSYGHVIHVDI